MRSWEETLGALGGLSDFVAEATAFWPWSPPPRRGPKQAGRSATSDPCPVSCVADVPTARAEPPMSVCSVAGALGGGWGVADPMYSVSPRVDSNGLRCGGMLQKGECHDLDPFGSLFQPCRPHLIVLTQVGCVRPCLYARPTPLRSTMTPSQSAGTSLPTTTIHCRREPPVLALMIGGISPGKLEVGQERDAWGEVCFQRPWLAEPPGCGAPVQRSSSASGRTTACVIDDRHSIGQHC